MDPMSISLYMFSIHVDCVYDDWTSNSPLGIYICSLIDIDYVLLGSNNFVGVFDNSAIVKQKYEPYVIIQFAWISDMLRFVMNILGIIDKN